MRPVRDTAERAEWDRLMGERHYLGFRGMFGDGLRHVAEGPDGEWLALLGWCAGAFKVGARDAWIGWAPEQQFRRLRLVANNCRFLVLARVPNLASRVLGLSVRRVSGGHGGAVRPSGAAGGDLCGPVALQGLLLPGGGVGAGGRDAGLRPVGWRLGRARPAEDGPAAAPGRERRPGARRPGRACVLGAEARGPGTAGPGPSAVPRPGASRRHRGRACTASSPASTGDALDRAVRDFAAARRPPEGALAIDGKSAPLNRPGGADDSRMLLAAVGHGTGVVAGQTASDSAAGEILGAWRLIRELDVARPRPHPRRPAQLPEDGAPDRRRGRRLRPARQRQPPEPARRRLRRRARGADRRQGPRPGSRSGPAPSSPSTTGPAISRPCRAAARRSGSSGNAPSSKPERPPRRSRTASPRSARTAPDPPKSSR